MTQTPLKEYLRKRDPQQTPEPMADKHGDSEENIFVVQKHAASRLHYDFRLSVDGVLKSWAVPKGPSLNPSDKRLAMPTEDHPRDYASFEGVIPKGNYGAGPVIVWDTGLYTPHIEDGGSVATALWNGHLEFELQGQKLKGNWALTRMGRRGDGEKWLLVKMKDNHANATRNITRDEPQSVVSGRTIETMGHE